MWVNMKVLEWIEIIVLLAFIVVVLICIYYTAQIKCDVLGVDFNFWNALTKW